ncbi:MAG TPA: sensor histidine kinase [Bdellovibrionota bacterium]
MLRWIGPIIALLVVLGLAYANLQEGRGLFVRQQHATYIHDETGTLAPQQVLNRGDFQTIQRRTIPPRNGILWVKVPLLPEVYQWREQGVVLFTGANEVVWKMQAFLVNKGTIDNLGSCNALLNDSTCAIPALEYAFPLPAERTFPGSEILLRVETRAAMFDEFYFMRGDYYWRCVQLLVALIGASLAVCAFVVLLSLGTAFTLREPSSLLYGMFYLCLGVSSFINRGLWDLLFGGTWLPGSSHLAFPFIMLSVILDLAFVTAFFEFRTSFPRINKIFVATIATLIAVAVVGCFPTLRPMAWFILYPVVEFSMALNAVTLVYLIYKKRRWASSFTAAWTIAIVANLIYSAYRSGAFDGHWAFTYYAVAGRALESFFLTSILFQKLRALVTQRALAQAKDQENRIIRTLFRTLSHDLSNTTQALAGSSFACENASSDSARQEAIRNIDEAVSSQIAIIRHAKRSYISRGRDGVVNLSPVPVRRCFEQIQSLFSAHLQAKKVTLKVADCPEDLLVLAEPVSLTHQVLANLVSNAIKFSPPGGTVTLGTLRVDGEVRISVVDEGAGIPQGILDKLFDESFEVSQPGTAGEIGTGLGLLVVKDFVSIYGGQLAIHGNTGTAVTVTLREAPALSPSAPSPASTSALA